jgi:hypothetical protein
MPTVAQLSLAPNANAGRWWGMHRFLLLGVASLGWAAPLDLLSLGDAAAEKAHAIQAEGSEVAPAGRRLLPPAEKNWLGGRFSVEVAVDPVKPNYVTVLFDGSEASEGRLLLLVDGKQVGYRHLGDVPLLRGEVEEAPCPGKPLFITTPLPLASTQGRRSVRLEFRATGTIWGYGRNFDEYQKPMTKPSATMLALFTHTEPDDLPATPPGRATPAAASPTEGEAIVDEIRQHVIGHTQRLIGKGGADSPHGQVALLLLARATRLGWTPAYHAPKALDRIVLSLDDYAVKYAAKPDIEHADGDTYNPGWFGFGMAAEALRLVAADLPAARLDEPLAGTTRRAAWSRLFLDSREWHRRHRRLYTNQSMIVDLNIYRCNRALRSLGSPEAWPEPQALRYLHEATGVLPWSGSDTEQGPAWSQGKSYFQLTCQGLTRELGFVGYYGEVLDWVSQILEATQDEEGRPDPVLLAQAVKIARARLPFRHPAVDAAGRYALRAETVVGWRDDNHLPGDVTYVQRNTWDGSPFQLATLTRDPGLMALAGRQLRDGQLYAVLRQKLKDGGLRNEHGLLTIPDEVAAVRAGAREVGRFPMEGPATFVFADPEDGVVAIRDRDVILYVSLYWRARHGVNALARVHLVTPRFEQVATVREAVRFEPSGLTYTRKDWTNWGFANGGFRYPDGVHSAHAGETLPIAKIPDGVAFKAGDEHPAAGRCDLYAVAVGGYFIVMNTTATRSFEVEVPAGFDLAADLAGGASPKVLGARRLEAPPWRTLVLRQSR